MGTIVVLSSSLFPTAPPTLQMDHSQSRCKHSDAWARSRIKIKLFLFSQIFYVESATFFARKPFQNKCFAENSCGTQNVIPIRGSGVGIGKKSFGKKFRACAFLERDTALLSAGPARDFASYFSREVARYGLQNDFALIFPF